MICHMKHSFICGWHLCLKLWELTCYIRLISREKHLLKWKKNCCIFHECKCSTQMNPQEVASSPGEWHTHGIGVRLSFLRLRDWKSRLLRWGIFYLSYFSHSHFVGEAGEKEPEVAGEERTDICRRRNHVHPFACLFCWRFSMLVIDKGQKSLYSLNFQMCPPMYISSSKLS